MDFDEDNYSTDSSERERGEIRLKFDYNLSYENPMNVSLSQVHKQCS